LPKKENLSHLIYFINMTRHEWFLAEVEHQRHSRVSLPGAIGDSIFLLGARAGNFGRSAETPPHETYKKIISSDLIVDYLLRPSRARRYVRLPSNQIQGVPQRLSMRLIHFSDNARQASSFAGDVTRGSDEYAKCPRHDNPRLRVSYIVPIPGGAVFHKGVLGALHRFPSAWPFRTKLWGRHDAPRAFYE
jgi:hypothetical protein